VLTPLGFLLDLLFGNAFFVFPNKLATLGWGVPALGGAIKHSSGFENNFSATCSHGTMRRSSSC
jgi:hypothetical protein